jgi:hypothetical protein
VLIEFCRLDRRPLPGRPRSNHEHIVIVIRH